MVAVAALQMIEQKSTPDFPRPTATLRAELVRIPFEPSRYLPPDSSFLTPLIEKLPTLRLLIRANRCFRSHRKHLWQNL
jgi:hypothetical protein